MMKFLPKKKEDDEIIILNQSDTLQLKVQQAQVHNKVCYYYT